MKMYDFVTNKLIKYVEENKNLTYDIQNRFGKHEIWFYINSVNNSNSFVVKLTDDAITHWEIDDIRQYNLDKTGLESLMQDVDDVVKYQVRVSIFNNNNEKTYGYVWIEKEPIEADSFLKHITTNLIDNFDAVSRIVVSNFTDSLNMSFVKDGNTFSKVNDGNEKK